MHHPSETLPVAIQTNDTHTYVWMETLPMVKPVLVWYEPGDMDMHTYTYMYKWKQSTHRHTCTNSQLLANKHFTLACYRRHMLPHHVLSLCAIGDICHCSLCYLCVLSATYVTILLSVRILWVYQSYLLCSLTNCKNAQMTTLHTNWSLYMTFTIIYYVRQE